MSLSGEGVPLPALCELAARALDGVELASAVLGRAALHVRTGGHAAVTGDELLQAVLAGAEPEAVTATRRAYFGL